MEVVCKKRSKSRNFCSARHASLWVQPRTISSISFKFNCCMLLALMKLCDQPLAEQSFHLLSPSPAIRLNDQIQTMKTESQKMGARYGPTKYPCNWSHLIQLRCSSCNTQVWCLFSPHLQGIQLWLERLGAGDFVV